MVVSQVWLLCACLSEVPEQEETLLSSWRSPTDRNGQGRGLLVSVFSIPWLRNAAVVGTHPSLPEPDAGQNAELLYRAGGGFLPRNVLRSLRLHQPLRIVARLGYSFSSHPTAADPESYQFRSGLSTLPAQHTGKDAAKGINVNTFPLSHGLLTCFHFEFVWFLPLGLIPLLPCSFPFLNSFMPS